MWRSALKKTTNNSSDPFAAKTHKKQINYVVNISRKTKKEFFHKRIPHGSFSENYENIYKLLCTNKTTNFDEKNKRRW